MNVNWYDGGALWIEQFVDAITTELRTMVLQINALNLIADKDGEPIALSEEIYKYHVKNFNGEYAIAAEVRSTEIEQIGDRGTSTIRLPFEIMIFCSDIANPENDTTQRRKLANLVMNYVNNKITTLTTNDGWVWRNIIAKNANLWMLWPFSGNTGVRVQCEALADTQYYITGV